jgi:glycine dehydrogenase
MSDVSTATKTSLRALTAGDDFVRRHIGPSDDDIAVMLRQLGSSGLDELIDEIVPPAIRARAPSGALRPSSRLGRSEHDTLAYLQELAGRNRVLRSFIGLGYHGTITPSVIRRNILENPGWYTAYTPYQAEISQGRLEALLNYQTMVLELTGMEIANASLLDEATAAAEAMALAAAVVNKKSRERTRFWVSRDCHPQTIDVVRTRARPLGFEVVVGTELELDASFFGALLQYPGSSGALEDPRKSIEKIRAAGALAIVAADILGLVLLTPPGEFGADVVLGSTQRFGVPMGYGGPHAAFFATREEYKRVMPGRLVGVSVDAQGRRAFRLALQTREQHIRREKATSNICTAQVLLAVIASMYAIWHGPAGLQAIARRVHRLACVFAAGLERLGVALVHRNFFDTVAARVASADAVIGRAASGGRNLRRIDDRTVGVSFDETSTLEDIEALWEALSGRAAKGLGIDELDASVPDAVPDDLVRKSPPLSHAIFDRYHSETELMRYASELREKDISLTRSMIPLGSCTMKLNAATEMLPITWPAFSQLHPFAPADQCAGSRALIRELEERLAAITGFHAVSLQPNAGSQGEYAGLLAIRAWHESRHEAHRDVCLIPSSAHGTNPASAAMAGLRVVVVACDSNGNIDLEDLRSRCAEHADRLACIMVTYPSTHGVFEEGITRLCEIVHAHGGQVYMDGANMNALVGICKPGEFGPDVAHLNLHKTFCIPHGGGGPGVGPIALAKHLAPFRPGHPLVPELAESKAVGAVSAAPWGSAGILPIPFAYILLMGDAGLEKATKVAILNANYIATRLAIHYEILYRGRGGRVAHECILDLRPLKSSAGVEASDVAKRLMDFGFHAPTMSFPVPGTLMVEPTESESLAELDRFCEAMIAIREEIRAIEDGRLDREDNPLKNAPHTAEDVCGDAWTHPYGRELGAFPLPWVRRNKYWPPVGLIDNVYGDRNFVCSCPPIESYSS